MRIRTILALSAAFFLFGGLAIGGFVLEQKRGTETSVRWVSDTARSVAGNHHAPAVGTIDGQPFVYAPVSGDTDTDGCALIALNGTTGDRDWDHSIPAPHCTIHSVADPTVADYDSDSDREVLVATTEDRLTAHDPRSGVVEFAYDLTSYGYTKPLVRDITGDERPEILVVDVNGTVAVARADGTTVWRRHLDSAVWAQPSVADFDGNGRLETAVATGGSRELHLFGHDGTPVWSSPVTFESSIAWMAKGQATEDAAREIVVATANGGRVAAVDGTGTRLWERDLGSFAAVHAVVDGDDDGTAEVYAVTDTGTLSSLTATNGTTEWQTKLTTADVQMMPPPAAGDVDGDGSLELVAPTNDGLVALVDPTSGDIVSTYERNAPVFTHPTLADVDGDGDVEAFVMYGRGRVVALDFERV